VGLRPTKINPPPSLHPPPFSGAKYCASLLRAPQTVVSPRHFARSVFRPDQHILPFRGLNFSFQTHPLLGPASPLTIFDLRSHCPPLVCLPFYRYPYHLFALLDLGHPFLARSASFQIFSRWPDTPYCLPNSLSFGTSSPPLFPSFV